MSIRRRSTIVEWDEDEFDHEIEEETTESETREERENEMDIENETGNGGESTDSSTATNPSLNVPSDEGTEKVRNLMNEIQSAEVIDDNDDIDGIEEMDEQQVTDLDRNGNSDREQRGEIQTERQRKSEHGTNPNLENQQELHRELFGMNPKKEEEKGDDGKEQKNDSDRIPLNQIEDGKEKKSENAKDEIEQIEQEIAICNEFLKTDQKQSMIRRKSKKSTKNQGNQRNQRNRKKKNDRNNTGLLDNDEDREPKRNMNRKKENDRKQNQKSEKDEDTDSNQIPIGDTDPSIPMGSYPDSNSDGNENQSSINNSNSNSLGTKINLNYTEKDEEEYREYEMYRDISKSVKRKRYGPRGRSEPSVLKSGKRKFKKPRFKRGYAPMNKRQKMDNKPTLGVRRSIQSTKPKDNYKRTSRERSADEQRCETICGELNESTDFMEIVETAILELALKRNVQCVEVTMMRTGIKRNNHNLNPMMSGVIGINAGIPGYFKEKDKNSCSSIKNVPFQEIAGVFPVQTEEVDLEKVTVSICNDLYITGTGTVRTVEMPIKWRIPKHNFTQYGYGAIELICNQDNLSAMEKDRECAESRLKTLKKGRCRAGSKKMKWS